MDRISLTIVTVGFVLMLGAVSIVAYQAVLLGHIQQQTIDLIVRTHKYTPGN